MSKPSANLPPDVLNALKTLENAASPTELGKPYKILTDWRRTRPSFRLQRKHIEFAAATVLVVSLILALRHFEFGATELQRGIVIGLGVGALLHRLADFFTPSKPTAPSVLDRVDVAIDRWRHAVPAMRDFPK